MTAASDMLLSVFDRIYVINLAHRDDRRREMEAELNRIGLGLDHPAVTLFPASFPPDQGDFPSRGARGCFESHLGVHRAIVKDGVRRALLLEDDVGLPPDFGAGLATLATDLQDADWDIFYSVLPVAPKAGDSAIGDQLLRLAPGHDFKLAHFVGFSAEFSRQAVPYLQAMYERPPGDPRGGPMHVDGAYCWLRRASPDLIALASRRPLATQRASRSDIADLPLWDRLPVVRQISAALRQSPTLVRLVKKAKKRLR